MIEGVGHLCFNYIIRFMFYYPVMIELKFVTQQLMMQAKIILV